MTRNLVTGGTRISRVISRAGRPCHFMLHTISALFLFLSITAATSAQQASSLLGDWSGESICVGEVGACHDEQVVYHLAISKSDPKKFTLSADKIVDGKPEPMGDIDFAFDPANHILTGEFQNPRNHLLIQYTVKGNMMWGTMMLLPERRVVRQMRVTKSDSNQTKTTMTQHATGTFEVKLTSQDDETSDASMGRMTIKKQWQGEILGTSTGQMLTGGDLKTGSAGYVAMEKFTGSVKGRKGTLIFQHSATMNAGQGDLNITVVPGSGTDELKGITGKLTIKIEGGQHLYDFEYTIK
jgi:hypothetical protein